MRLDKFLKVSRIIKRRPIAKLVIDGGKVKLDGKVAKAAAEVKVGQILEIEYYNKYFNYLQYLFYFIYLRKFLTENYLVIVATTPEATVLPPSLIANLNPSSIAIG